MLFKLDAGHTASNMHGKEHTIHIVKRQGKNNDIGIFLKTSSTVIGYFSSRNRGTEGHKKAKYKFL